MIVRIEAYVTPAAFTASDLSITPAAIQTATQNTDSATAASVPDDSQPFNLWWWLLIGVAVLAVIGLIVMLRSRNHN
jgi:hypothetical protein